MRDLAEKWSAVPDWKSAVIEGHRISVTTVQGLSQYLVSGDINAWRARTGLDGLGVGAFATASGSRYCVRLARDRLLLVAADGAEMAAGWHEAGFAVSCVSAAFQVFEIGGEAALDIAARATTLDPAGSSPSAAIAFAGTNAIVYRHENGDLRVHVDRTLAPYLWTWFEITCQALASASGERTQPETESTARATPN